MTKDYISLGLMSGTSGDGVDASIIQSDGNTKFTPLINKYYEYDSQIYDKIHSLREKISFVSDLKKLSKDILSLEREITIFHAEVVSNISKKTNIDLVGFHGQTIFHKPKEKITKQIGNGELLAQLSKKTVIFNFRENDIKNGGQGAPLTPIFHRLLSKKINKEYKIEYPIYIVNIGGITNVTAVQSSKKSNTQNFFANDVGPGNCLIDEWIRKKTKNKFDKSGSVARIGKINELILNQAIDNFFDNKLEISSTTPITYDPKDFDVSFVRGLSFEDGAATLTAFTALVISKCLKNYIIDKSKKNKYLVCGGGRKNTYLMELISKYFIENTKKISFESIDKYNVDGDFVESQAFAYLAIRSFLKLPISFPETTGCHKPISGGDKVVVK